MSDGMSDSRAESALAQEVWSAAFDLSELAVHLTKAVQKARLGHRGWGLARSWIVAEVNLALRETGFVLVDHAPEKSFEHYPDAYERQPTRWERIVERDAWKRGAERMRSMAAAETLHPRGCKEKDIMALGIPDFEEPESP
jgi:hypothetical protein